ELSSPCGHTPPSCPSPIRPHDRPASGPGVSLSGGEYRGFRPLLLPFDLGHLDEVPDLEDHPTDGGVVLLHHRSLMAEPERLQRCTLVMGRPDPALYLLDHQIRHLTLPRLRPERPVRGRAARVSSGAAVHPSSPAPCSMGCSNPGSWSGCRGCPHTPAPRAPDRRRSRRFPAPPGEAAPRPHPTSPGSRAGSSPPGPAPESWHDAQSPAPCVPPPKPRSP